MGVEEFLVRIESGRPANDVLRVLRTQPNVYGDPMTEALTGYDYLRFEDPDHIIEIEVSSGTRGSIASVRFALSHPSSIDKIFVALVDRLTRELHGRATIAEDVGPADQVQHLPFGDPGYARLEPSILECIREKRERWQAEFGRDTARLTCRQTVKRFVMKDPS